MQITMVRAANLIPVLVLLAAAAYLFLSLSGTAKSAKGLVLPAFAAVIAVVWLIVALS